MPLFATFSDPPLTTKKYIFRKTEGRGGGSEKLAKSGIMDYPSGLKEDFGKELT